MEKQKIPAPTEKKWDLKRWLTVFLCILLIYATIPLARRIQNYVYLVSGKELFTYIVLFFIALFSLLTVYLLIFRYRVKNPLQYIWLFLCSGALIYYTFSLKQYPEEAVHFLEYGLLAFLIFRALSQKIRDSTVYIITILLVALVGTMDEFIQWIIPNRYWAFQDIGLNIFSGTLCVFIIWQVLKPKIIDENLQRYSIKILLGIITLDLLILGLCLSNTPDSVYFYTDHLKSLSWLRNEEKMTEYGYKFRDPEIGTVYSRYTPEDLRTTDHKYGAQYGQMIPRDVDTREERAHLIKKYKPPINPFFYEFLLHLFRRDNNYDDLSAEISAYEAKRLSNTVLKEHIILKKYFAYTLKSAGQEWSADKMAKLEEKGSLEGKDYISSVGSLIVRFRLKTAWFVILILLAGVWAMGLRFLHLYKKHQ